jgi:nicotinamide-nucleotide amidase
MIVSILGIGTELTSGQILNRNAQWIATQLKKLGFSCSCHLVVADDRQDIFDALHFCAQRSDIIISTGGLGPTTDDFTKDVIAKWSQKELTFDADSWQHVQDQLNARNVPVRDFQKQQAYFPKNSKIYKNSFGTANAFKIEHQSKKVYALPGPPKEIEGLWNDFLEKEFSLLAQSLDPMITESWECLGQGESEIAHLTEKALTDCPFEKGYRVHLPYVEVKLSYKKSQKMAAQKWVQSLDKALKPYTTLRNSEDIAFLLSEKLNSYKKILIADEFSGVHLLNRLFPYLKKLLAEQKVSYTVSTPLIPSPDYDLILSLKSDKTAQINDKTIQLKSPFSTNLMLDREKLLFSELAILSWYKGL